MSLEGVELPESGVRGGFAAGDPIPYMERDLRPTRSGRAGRRSWRGGPHLKTITLDCPPNTLVLGGGQAKSSDLIDIQDAEPSGDHRSCTVTASIARANTGVFIAADAICGNA